MNDWTSLWRQASVEAQREVGRGQHLLTLHLEDDLPFPFEPGHVIALRAPGRDGSLMRHPYTLSRARAAERTLDILFRVIPHGRLTPFLAALPIGSPVEISGLHHQPIRAEIAPEARTIVGFSTGSGIGPLWGFAEQALAMGETRPITLFAGYREAADIALMADLDALAASHPAFRWYPSLTRPEADWTGLRGRVTESAPPLIQDPLHTHFHLVGNGSMLADMEAALEAVGVPGEMVTDEVFFNYNAQADPQAVAALAARFHAKGPFPTDPVH